MFSKGMKAASGDNTGASMKTMKILSILAALILGITLLAPAKPASGETSQHSEASSVRSALALFPPERVCLQKHPATPPPKTFMRTPS
jgi:hypothetical protein